MDASTEIKALKTELKALKAEVARLQDLEDINRLQKTYGYYLEHWMYEDIIDLFADSPDTELNLTYGIFYGKEGVKKYFAGMLEMTQHLEFMHQIMQLSGVVDVDASGKGAKGRWYGFGAVAMPRKDGIFQVMSSGIYTVEYIKKNGKWQILKLMWNAIYDSRPGTGWIKEGKKTVSLSRDNSLVVNSPKFDKKRELNTRYPSGYIVPFHYKHPVTGKPSSEARRNATNKKKSQ
ncbi:MAG TPA: nuclear transport factor 2 family protein [Dehalococcoidales bacterium]|nr:nuclear transport factor 2 family protein [Dehalococcoidales bacterium]